MMLDQNLTGILPELMGIDLLHGWDDEGNPKLSRPKTQPTLRQLLSHQSGIGVDISEPILIRWNEYKQRATTSQTGDVVRNCLLSFE